MTIAAHKLERIYVASPIRRYLHQPLITRWFKRSLPADFAPQNILEIGSGTGAGLLALAKAFPEAHIQGIEIDSAMAKTARRRISTAGINAAIHVGPFGAKDYRASAHANTYDLIVSYGCFHHIPDWQAAIQHARAALKDGGYLCAEEYYAPLLDNPLFKFVGTHPPQRFTHNQWLSVLEAQGFTLANHRNHFGCAGLICVQK